MSTSRPSAWGLIIGPLAALALLIGLLALAAPAQAAFPGANGKIAFKRVGCYASFCDREAIWLMNPDGSNQTRLGPGRDPSWSADGQRIAFAADANPPLSDVTQYEIFVMNADGTGLTRLTRDPAYDFDPTWSPDGTRIAFDSGGLPNADVYVMDADGSNVRNVTNNPAFDARPAWSPDGHKIAFESNRTPGVSKGLFVMNPDGSDQTLVKQVSATNSNSPDWSPDGSQLVYVSGAYDIHIVRYDGTGERVLPTGDPQNAAFDLEPTWSPDGSRIAWARFEGFGLDWEIFSANLDGSDRINLTRTEGGSSTGDAVDDFDPSWQPVNRPPDCSDVRATPSLLSPADRSLPLVGMGGASDSDGDAVSLTITGVTQDEPLTGDGDTTGQDAFSKYFTSDPYVVSLLENKANEVYLRAEARKHGDGRVYQIAFTGSDGKGETCSETTSVRVPSPKGLTVDSAPPSYNSFGP